MSSGIEREKREVLEKNGYVFDFRRMIYVNSNTKKIFSFEAIRDNPLSWLKTKIGENSKGTKWNFYFKQAPSEELKSVLTNYFQG